jgi:flagellar protein FliS
MTAETTVNAYLRTRVLTASPEQLRLMLLEGAIRFLRQGRDGLARKDFEASFDGMSKARNIVIELMNSMRPEVAPDLCAKVHGLYVYIYRTIVDAGLEKSIEKADKAIEMLEFERETWVLTMEKVAAERRGGAVVPAAAAAPVIAEPGPSRPHQPLSVQG